ncbi:MAG: zf-HC2 domain-containing protein [bacterium]|nr:zf-HC2 domain-containing protein [bacterium]
MSLLEFECVDPKIGEQMHLFDDESLDPDLRDQLERHLAVCHACSEGVHFESFVAGRLASPRGAGFFRKPTTSLPGYLAMTAVLAAILLLFLLPPGYGTGWLTDDREGLRGGDEREFMIIRPLEGEVLYRWRGDLRWTPVVNTSFYNIHVEWRSETSSEGATWRDQVRTCQVSLPDSLMREGAFLAIVKPYPEGLVPAGERAVGFRRGSLLPFLAYRIKHPPLASLALLALSLGVGTAMFYRRRI